MSSGAFYTSEVDPAKGKWLTSFVYYLIHFYNPSLVRTENEFLGPNSSIADVFLPVEALPHLVVALWKNSSPMVRRYSKEVTTQFLFRYRLQEG